MTMKSSAGSADALLMRLARALGETRQPGLVSAYLFGSAADDRAHGESDIDLGIYFDPRRHPTSASRFDALLDLTRELGPALGRNDLDLVVMNDAPPPLCRHIIFSGRRAFCSDEKADHAFRRTTLSRAADLEPFLRRTRQIMLAALAR